MQEIVILGIDPGFSVTGYAVLKIIPASGGKKQSAGLVDTDI